jgi:hypothetical protein
MITEFFGEYTVTAFTGNAIAGGTYSAPATSGCFLISEEKPAGSSAPANTVGVGFPNETGFEAESLLDSGALTSFTLTNLTPTSGSGSFSFTNGAGSTATGTVTITGSMTETVTEALHRSNSLRARGALVIRAR